MSRRILSIVALLIGNAVGLLLAALLLGWVCDCPAVHDRRGGGVHTGSGDRRTAVDQSQREKRACPQGRNGTGCNLCWPVDYGYDRLGPNRWWRVEPVGRDLAGLVGRADRGHRHPNVPVQRTARTEEKVIQTIKLNRTQSDRGSAHNHTDLTARSAPDRWPATTPRQVHTQPTNAQTPDQPRRPTARAAQPRYEHPQTMWPGESTGKC